MRRTRTSLYGLLVGLLLPLAGLFTPAGTAYAAENGTWGVFPTPPAGAAMTDRAYFFHQGAAGSSVSDSVTILNSSAKDLTFQVFATDAMNTPSGGAFALLPAETKPKDVGTWLKLPRTRPPSPSPPRAARTSPSP